MPVNVPNYDDLPLNETLGMRHCWGIFGEGDEIGTLNHAGPAERLRALASVREGKLINLSLPITEPSPAMFGRKPLEHVIISHRNAQDDYVNSFYLQCSSQWDGLRHQGAREFGFYGGRQLEEINKAGPGPLGIEGYVEHGICGRGVLLDAAAHFDRQGTAVRHDASLPIEVGQIEAMLEAQEVAIEPGDFVLLRTGWLRSFRQATAEERAPYLRSPDRSPGLRSGEAMARYLWNSRIAGIAADNPALEVLPIDPADGFLHRRILALLGMLIGELFDLEALAEACAARRRYHFLLAAAPLNLPGAIGSPANAFALL